MIKQQQIWKWWPCDYPGSWTAIWVEAVGVSTCPQPCGCRRGQPVSCIHLVSQGSIRYRMANGVDVLVKPGEMFAEWPGIEFGYEAGDDTRAGAVVSPWLRFLGPRRNDFVASLGFTREQPVLTPNDPDGVARIMAELLELVDRDPPDADARAIALLYQLPAACRFTPVGKGKTESLAERAKRILESEAVNGMNVNQLSQALGVSRVTLFTKCKEELGVTPSELLTATRLNHASELLTHSDLRVQDIALQSGYSDPRFFARQFKQHKGCTPSEYRTGN